MEKKGQTEKYVSRSYTVSDKQKLTSPQKTGEYDVLYVLRGVSPSERVMKIAIGLGTLLGVLAGMPSLGHAACTESPGISLQVQTAAANVECDSFPNLTVSFSVVGELAPAEIIVSLPVGVAYFNSSAPASFDSPIVVGDTTIGETLTFPADFLFNYTGQLLINVMSNCADIPTSPYTATIQSQLAGVYQGTKGESCPSDSVADSTQVIVTKPPCGDGVVGAGETCDDGNTVTETECPYGTSFCSLCNATCNATLNLSGRTCGDGINDPEEICDDAALNGMYDACDADCGGLGPRCGDGVMNGPEDCDDANMTNTDSCVACVNADCGDGFVQANVEACDDGNQIDEDECTNACQAAQCGDGIVYMGMEACDDGNSIQTDACLSDCLTASCGDGFVHAGIEACDDGNKNNDNDDGCTTMCTLRSCGDGIVQAGEGCDDGNTSNTDSCLTTCQGASCGDGYIWDGAEDCDDTSDNCVMCMLEEPSGPDAGMFDDGGMDTSPDTDGGCSCRVSGGTAPSQATLLLVGLCLLSLLRRQRRD